MGKRASTQSSGTPRGPEGFERYYADLFADRWPALRESLLASGTTVAFTRGLEAPYYLDPASILAAECLEVEPTHEVLDLCAAPGGKSLVLASRLCETQGGETREQEARGRLVCNERSSARRARLHRVLDTHLGRDLRTRVQVAGHDAARWALHEPASYDRVLADVPCSSEQHVIQSQAALAEWSASRTRRLALGAYAIACAAVDSVRPGGRVVYSTCALSPLENDGVIAKLVKRGKGSISIVDAGPVIARAAADLPHLHGAPGSRTDCGWMILPDSDGGLGPIYIAIVERAPNGAEHAPD